MNMNNTGSPPEDKQVLYDIYGQLGHINAKLDGIDHLRSQMSEVDKKIDSIEDETSAANALANSASQSASSAHKRIDKLDKVVWWVSTTVIGSILLALLATVVTTQ